MNYYSRVNMYTGSILKGRGLRYQHIKNRYPIVIKYIEDSINSKRCPFCGREFKRVYSVKKHLKYNSECAYLFNRLVEMMINNMDEDRLKEFMGLPVERKREPSIMELLPNI